MRQGTDQQAEEATNPEAEQETAAVQLLVCQEHVELAIDIIVDEYEKAPIILTLEQAGLTGDAGSTKCARCDAPAAYVLS